MFENITFNDKPVRDLIIEWGVREDIKSLKRLLKTHIITKHGFYKPEGKKEVRFIMVNGKNVTSVQQIVEYVNNAAAMSKKFNVLDIVSELEIERSRVTRVLGFLNARFELPRFRKFPKDFYTYSPKNAIDMNKVMSSIHLLYVKYEKNTITKTKEKIPTDNNLSRAILLHATCRLTKIPWHSEDEEIKNTFLRFVQEVESMEIIKLALDFAFEIKNKTEEKETL